MFWFRIFRPAAAFLALLLAVTGAPRADESTETLRRLTSQQDFRAAYDLAAGLVPELAGEPDFDFHFALAALGIGRAGEAALALERVLMSQPSNERARLELGRAYLALGEYGNAKRSFERVLAANPPPNVRTRVENLLVFIEKQLTRGRWRPSAWGSASAGYDSNVNAATDVASVSVPALGGNVALNPSSREIEDGFTELAAGGELKYQVNQQAFGFGAMSVRDRNNFDTDAFDTVVASAQFGWDQMRQDDRWRIPVSVDGLWLDGERYRESAGLGLEWNREREGRSAPGVFVQGGVISYPTQAQRDARYWTAGAGLTKRFAARLLGLNVYYGDETAEDSAAAYNGRRYGGARVIGQWSVTQRMTAVAQIGAQESEYDAADPVFAKVRRESMTHGAIGLAWRSSGRLTWRLDGSFIANDSNLELYEYSRSVISGSVNYAF